MKRIQYTIRGISAQVDNIARKKARMAGTSLNACLLEALEKGLGLSEEPHRYADLDDLAGTWVQDPEFDRAIEEMDKIDPELWR